ncbi:MAG: hypothetical protein ABEI58_03365 [Candidatus Nanohaloarchaea archaeon]
MTHRKRLPAPKHYPISRKGLTYVSSIEGSRSPENAIPAVVLLREVLDYADSKKEAKKIVQDRNLYRNGEPVTDIRQGIGVLDVVEIPETEESYRVIRKGRNLSFVPVKDADKVAAKIVGKRVEDEEYVYRLHNGENYRTEDEYETGNTLVFNDSVKEVALEEGADVIVISGQHAGETAELKEIHERGMDDDTGVVEAEEEFETQLQNLVAVKGIELGE